MSHGFIRERIEGDHWVQGQGKATKRFGAATPMPGGHGWGKHKPPIELQNRNGLETMACIVFGSLNAWETSANFHGFADFPKNCSERFSAILAGITPQGGSPHRTCESIKKYGVIPEEALPWRDERTWDHFYAPNPMAEEFLALGREINRKFVLGHEWVWYDVETNKPRKLMAMLERAPVCVSVYAWKKRGNLYVKEGPDNHWVMITDYQEGKWWEVYDHYEAATKRLAWDTDFEQAKAYFIARREDVEGTLARLWRELSELVAGLFQVGSTRYDVPQVPEEKPVEPHPAPPTVPESEPKPVPAPIDYGEFPKLVKGLIQVESEGNDRAVGDLHLTDKAYGCLQIRKPVCIDVNRRYGLSLTPQQMLGNRQLSIDTFYKYMAIYATEKQIGRSVTYQDRARIWNGGPTGYKRASTVGYWAKVKPHL